MTHLKELLAKDIPIIQLRFDGNSDSMFPDPAISLCPSSLYLKEPGKRTHSICSNTSALLPSVLILSKIVLALRLS
jgi:hypothetical protein